MKSNEEPRSEEEQHELSVELDESELEKISGGSTSRVGNPSPPTIIRPTLPIPSGGGFTAS
jgi:hypothetical protein